MNTPPLAALEALDALERLGSVSAAADSLSLTQSAVSHKLRGLEKRLGFVLTRPHGRGVTLTGQARQYIETVRPALQMLRAAHGGVSAATGRLRVSCASGFAAHWLAGRLGGFRDRFPEIDLTLRTTASDGDGAAADLAIVFAATPPPQARFLLGVSFFPVCSPALVHGRRMRVSDMPQARLLHLGSRGDWAAWMAAAGRSDVPRGGMVFTDVQTMLSAAIAGQGFCLGDELTCDAALNQGRLVRPFRQTLTVDKAYHAVPGAGGLTAPAEAFLEWLTAEL